MSDIDRKTICLVRFWKNTFTTRQILNRKFHNASDHKSKNFALSGFELKNFQCVRLWIQNILSCYFSNFFREIRFWKRINFENQVLGSSSFISVFEENFTSTKSCFESIFSVETINVSPFVLSQKAWFWAKLFTEKDISE